MDIHDIKMFKRCTHSSIEKINNELKFRSDNKVFFRDIIYYSSISIGNDLSFDMVNTQLKINNILDVSKTMLVDKKIIWMFVQKN